MPAPRDLSTCRSGALGNDASAEAWTSAQLARTAWGVSEALPLVAGHALSTVYG